MEVTHCRTCPVCMGKGLVPNGFYSAIGIEAYTTTSTTPEQCKSCGGVGFLWTTTTEPDKK